MKTTAQISELNSVEAATYLQIDGPFAQQCENYEERFSQIDLLSKIVEIFNENHIGVFEAGTGVGKSYAYLIPSILWAVKNNERVIISTGTINLQNQLCDKDIPSVLSFMNKKIKFILMKGRQNYICKRRLQDASQTPNLFENNEMLDDVVAWAKNSDTGSRSDIPFRVKDSVWIRINSESDACMGSRCPFFEDCFVMKVRKRAQAANIIVVNHHLLFADLEARMNGGGYESSIVLPPYKRIVVDECHGIESAASSFFGQSFTRFKITRIMNQLYRKRKNSESGHLLNIAILSSNEEKVQNLYELSNRIKSDITNLETSAMDLLGKEYTFRLHKGTQKKFGPVFTCLEELSKDLGQLSDIVNIVMEGVAEEDRETPSFWETKMLSRRLEEFIKMLKAYALWNEYPENVYWLQKKMLSAEAASDSNPFYVMFNITPLNVAPIMNKAIYEMMSSVVFTSATIKIGNNYEFWMRRNGLRLAESVRIHTESFDSPFDYSKNMKFLVPSDAPFWNELNYQAFIENAIARLVKITNGKTLILFTSYESLNSAFHSVSLHLKDFEGTLLKQGDYDNSKILQMFREETESVLFATESFWQGVDVPGESLSQVIITKLPFTVPNDPVFSARAEAIEKANGNSFLDLSVPEAVTKFRQGVGRLIRSDNDRGVVICLDKRIYEKKYGIIFSTSLPDCEQIYEPLDTVLFKVRDFFYL